MMGVVQRLEVGQLGCGRLGHAHSRTTVARTGVLVGASTRLASSVMAMVSPFEMPFSGSVASPVEVTPTGIGLPSGGMTPASYTRPGGGVGTPLHSRSVAAERRPITTALPGPVPLHAEQARHPFSWLN